MIRTRMLAIPSAVAGTAFVAGTLAEVSSLITAAVHDALDDAFRPPVYDASIGVDADVVPLTQTTFGEV